MNKYFTNDNDPTISEGLYNSLGISLQVRSSGIFYTRYPSSQVFDEANSFISKRQKIENWKISEMNSGNNNIFSMVSQPYFKSILNTDGAVRIGDRIYVHFDSGLIAMVANNDIAAYNYVINTDENELFNKFNVRIFHKHYADKYVERMNNGSFIEYLVSDFKVDLLTDMNGVTSLTNRSVFELINDSKPIFEWSYSDGTVEIGNQPSRTISMNESVSVSVKSTDGEILGKYDPDHQHGGGLGGVWVGPNDGTSGGNDTDVRACHPGDPRDYITNLGNGNYRFNFGSWNGGQVEWKIDCESVESTSFNFVQQICCTGGVEVELCWQAPPATRDAPFCCETATIDVKPAECTRTAESKDEEEFTFSNGETWKIECLGWVETSGIFDGSTPGEVGARTLTFRQKSNGDFERKQPEFGIAGVTGYYADKDDDCDIHFIDQTSTNAGDDNTQENHDHSGARLIPQGGCDEDPSEIYSRHGLTVNGETKFYTKNGGKLWIQN